MLDKLNKRGLYYSSDTSLLLVMRSQLRIEIKIFSILALREKGLEKIGTFCKIFLHERFFCCKKGCSSLK